MPEIVETVTIDVTTEATAKRSKLINKKHLIVEALRGNTGKIYIGLSYQYTGAGLIDTKYEPIKVGEPRFYGAPPNKEINYIWYYAENSGDGFSYVASNGALTRPNFRGDIRLGKFVREEITSDLVNDTAKSETRTVPVGKRWFICGGWMHNADDVARECYVALKKGGLFVGYFKHQASLPAGDKARFPRLDAVSGYEFAPATYPIPAEAYEEIVFQWDTGGASTGGTAKSFLEYYEVDLT